jgi:TadE-like protein
MTHSRRERGAATVEFAIVAVVALIPLVLAVLQLGLLYVTKHTVQHATFLAARAGAVSHGSRPEMLRYLAKGLAPLHAGATRDLGPVDLPRAVATAYARAYADAQRPDRTRLRVMNPTRASFDDFERTRRGVREIPNVFVHGRPGPRSGQTLADANLLKLRVDYCAPLVVPLIDRIVTTALRELDPDPFRQQCYWAGRMPVVGHALVHMHSAARRELFEEVA